MTSVIFNDPSGSDYLYKFSGVQLNAPSGETLALGANANTADNSNAIVTVGESYIRIPQGVSNERPDISNSYVGMMRYLTTDNLLEYFNGQTNKWLPISLPAPTISSISPNYINFDASGTETNTNTYTLTGSNFNIAPGGISVEVIGNNGAGTILLPDSNSASSETSATFTFDPSGTEQLIGISNELNFAVKLTNTNSGFSSTLNNAIIATNAGPEFLEPSLFTPFSFQTFPVQDPCANFIVSGIDLSAPAHYPLNFTFVSGTAGGFNVAGGDISQNGPLTDSSNSTVKVPAGNRLSATASSYNFTMRVTDALNAISDANYTLTLANPTITSIDPSFITVFDVVDINITGNYFIRDTDISFNKGSNTLTQSEVSYNSITSLTVKDVSAGEAGIYDISLANGSVIVNVPSVVLNIVRFIDATGGDVVGTYTDSGVTYKYHIFKSTGSFTVNQTGSGPSSFTDVDYLIVGAGGGGWGSPDCCVGGGGGGAGGVLQGTYTSLSATTYTTNVGIGVNGLNGNSSSIFSLTAYGGGNGANYQVGNNGRNPGGVNYGDTVGSGGGAALSVTQTTSGGAIRLGGTGTPGQGNNGGSEQGSDGYTDRYGGGGGGAGGNGFNDNDGSTPGNGGIGVTTTIITTTIATSNSVGQVSGSDVYFGGGGGSSVRQNWSSAEDGRPGGLGGGGQGRSSRNVQPSIFNGLANTGGGGGGGTGGSGYGAAVSSTGGSGVIILRYRFSV